MILLLPMELNSFLVFKPITSSFARGAVEGKKPSDSLITQHKT
jgi:hypothetical protein